MFGGNKGTITNEIWKYIIKVKSWVLIKPTGMEPIAVTGHASVLIGSSMYTFFGFNKDLLYTKYVQKYDLGKFHFLGNWVTVNILHIINYFRNISDSNIGNKCWSNILPVKFCQIYPILETCIILSNIPHSGNLYNLVKYTPFWKPVLFGQIYPILETCIISLILRKFHTDGFYSIVILREKHYLM